MKVLNPTQAKKIEMNSIKLKEKALGEHSINTKY